MLKGDDMELTNKKAVHWSLFHCLIGNPSKNTSNENSIKVGGWGQRWTYFSSGKGSKKKKNSGIFHLASDPPLLEKIF